MRKRRFIKGFFFTLAVAGLLLIGGCGKAEKPARVGNEEKLWQLAASPGKIEEPLEVPYAKKTPAFFRDASMGKVDPSFVPKITGG
jgi:hypothetical protein